MPKMRRARRAAHESTLPEGRQCIATHSRAHVAGAACGRHELEAAASRNRPAWCTSGGPRKRPTEALNFGRSHLAQFLAPRCYLIHLGETHQISMQCGAWGSNLRTRHARWARARVAGGHGSALLGRARPGPGGTAGAFRPEPPPAAWAYRVGDARAQTRPDSPRMNE